jgi:hypothetical protein
LTGGCEINGCNAAGYAPAVLHVVHDYVLSFIFCGQMLILILSASQKGAMRTYCLI